MTSLIFKLDWSALRISHWSKGVDDISDIQAGLVCSESEPLATGDSFQ